MVLRSSQSSGGETVGTHCMSEQCLFWKWSLIRGRSERVQLTGKYVQGISADPVTYKLLLYQAAALQIFIYLTWKRYWQQLQQSEDCWMLFSWKDSRLMGVKWFPVDLAAFILDSLKHIQHVHLRILFMQFPLKYIDYQRENMMLFC